MIVLTLIIFFMIICFIGMIGSNDRKEKLYLTLAFISCLIATVIMYAIR